MAQSALQFDQVNNSKEVSYTIEKKNTKLSRHRFQVAANSKKESTVQIVEDLLSIVQLVKDPLSTVQLVKYSKSTVQLVKDF